MDQSRRGRQLREVKGLLHRLQELPAERQPADSPSAGLGFRRGYLIGIASTMTVVVTVGVVLAFGSAYLLTGFGPQPTSTPKDDPSRQPAAPKVSEPAGVVAGAAAPAPPEQRPGVSTIPSSVVARAAAPSEQRPGGSTVSPAVEAAQALLNAGRVKAARQRLLTMVSDDSPNVAWTLARSYDPNHLKAIEGADAEPDVAEATRWYRAWHAAAVKQGMIADSVSLEKIIGSMRP